MSDLTHFEQAVMEMLLDGDAEVLSNLREQLKIVAVTQREMTGVGFYTTMSVPDEMRRLPGALSFKFGDVIAEIPGLNLGAGFLLYVEDGALHMLEGYTYEEAWPEQIVAFELTYMTGPRRDMESLQKLLCGDNAQQEL